MKKIFILIISFAVTFLSFFDISAQVITGIHGATTEEIMQVNGTPVGLPVIGITFYIDTAATPDVLYWHDDVNFIELNSSNYATTDLTADADRVQTWGSFDLDENFTTGTKRITSTNGANVSTYVQNSNTAQMSSTNGTNTTAIVSTSGSAQFNSNNGIDASTLAVLPTGFNLTFGGISDFGIDGDRGTSGQYFGSNGNDVAPSWQTIPATPSPTYGVKEILFADGITGEVTSSPALTREGTDTDNYIKVQRVLYGEETLYSNGMLGFKAEDAQDASVRDRFSRARGTIAAPTSLIDDDLISDRTWRPHNGTAYTHAMGEYSRVTDISTSPPKMEVWFGLNEISELFSWNNDGFQRDYLYNQAALTQTSTNSGGNYTRFSTIPYYSDEGIKTEAEGFAIKETVIGKPSLLINSTDWADNVQSFHKSLVVTSGGDISTYYWEDGTQGIITASTSTNSLYSYRVIPTISDIFLGTPTGALTTDVTLRSEIYTSRYNNGGTRYGGFMDVITDQIGVNQFSVDFVWKSASDVLSPRSVFEVLGQDGLLKAETYTGGNTATTLGKTFLGLTGFATDGTILNVTQIDLNSLLTPFVIPKKMTETIVHSARTVTATGDGLDYGIVVPQEFVGSCSITVKIRFITASTDAATTVKLMNDPVSGGAEIEEDSGSIPSTAVTYSNAFTTTLAAGDVLFANVASNGGDQPEGCFVSVQITKL